MKPFYKLVLAILVGYITIQTGLAVQDSTAGLSIAQMNIAAPNQSLWVFLKQLPNTMEAQVFYALLLSGSIGIIAHYFRQWYSGKIEGSLFEYLFKQEPRRTIAAFAVYVGWVLSLLGTGVFTTSSGEFVGWGIVLIMGLTNGYSIDSLTNKANPKETS